MAIKTLTVKAWDIECPQCGKKFDLEDSEARMAPDVALYVVPGDKPCATLQSNNRAQCPHCRSESLVNPSYLGKGSSKKIELSLLVHPQWLAGSPSKDAEGKPYGGSAQDDAQSTARWNAERASKIRLLEVRGSLPEDVVDPETGLRFAPEKGTVPKSANFACGSCGTVQPIVTSLAATKKTAPTSVFAIQGYCPKLGKTSAAYNGRFFSAMSGTSAIDAANREWEERKDGDLKDFWPRSAIPFGHMTHQRQPLPQHGYLNWADMFNSR